ncbi:MAG: serine/threonine-protein kinase [Planctomycetota bacterium]|jgi:serine/threonine-protein kinase|nr:serine/threonine-protein kinase [Planctomycetota bacterium]MDP6502326.1 serine/threonine-protein kinase [Planctomycetota bacterium]
MPSTSTDSPRDSAVIAPEKAVNGNGSRRAPKNKIGRYNLIQKLGSGELGNVYRARQWGIERDVVIKVLPKRLQKDEAYLKRFYSEAKAAGKLQHINIVKAIDVGLSETGHHFFVMECVEGKNIKELFECVTSFEERRAVGIIIQVVRALIHADARNMFHGEVRPENIHITKGEVVKLAGLGLAKELVDNSPQRTRALLVAAHYASPEEVRGETKDIRSDIFCLGATLYHMITGETPFEGESAVEVLASRLSEQLRSPRHFNRGISDGLCHVLEAMLAREPEDRFQSPQELLDELERVLEGRELRSERIDSSKTCLERTTALPPLSATTGNCAAGGAGSTRQLQRRRVTTPRSVTRRYQKPRSNRRARNGSGGMGAFKSFTIGLAVGLSIISGLVMAYFHFR